VTVCPVCSSSQNKVVDKWSGYSLVHCDCCEVVYANPMKSPGHEWYEKNEFYQIERQLNRTSARRTSEINLRTKDEEFLKNFSSKELNLLDVGCGQGFFLEKARDKFASATGIDFDSESVRVCQEKGLEVYCMGIEDFLREYPQRKFDVITMWYVIEHVEDPAGLIELARNLLSKDGFLVMTVPNGNSALIRPENNKLFMYPPHHLTLWDKISVKNLFEMHGYTTCRIDNGLCLDDINDFISTLLLKKIYSTKQALISHKKPGLINFLRSLKRRSIQCLTFLFLPALKVFLKEGSIILCIARPA